jgi:sugar fermentation stimulation protein A
MIPRLTPTSSLTIEHPFDGRPLLPARFVERPNRFIGVFYFEDDPRTPYKAHIADPGRLKELLLPDARVWVVDYRDHPTRKLPFAMPYVESKEGHVVSIYSRLPNTIAEALLNANVLPGYQNISNVKREPRFINPETGSKSTFDFSFTTADNKPALLEVKGASLVEDSVCKFPDAPTTRGTRQLYDLLAAHKAGYQTGVLFICQRPDAHTFTPYADRDPDFAKAVATLLAKKINIQWLPTTITDKNITLITK